MLKKLRIIKGTVSYSLGSYIAIAIGFFVSILSKKILGVEGTGQWATLIIFLSYGLIFGSLGIETAVTREIPQAKGRNNPEEIKQMINTAFTFSVLLGITISSIYIGISRFFIKNVIISKGLLFLALLLIVTLLYNLTFSILKSKKKIPALSRIVVINAVLVGLFSLPLAHFYGVIGYIIGTILSTFMSFFISVKLSKIYYSWHLSFKRAFKLIGIGLPMLIAGLIENTFLSIDKIIIGTMLGAPALGLYTIATMSTQQLTSLPRFFQTVLFPYVQEDYGKKKSIAELKPYFTRSLYIISRLLPFLIGFILFFIPLIVRIFLPKFIGGLLAMEILVIGFYFIVLNETNNLFIYTVNKQKILPFLYTGILAVSAGLSYLAIIKGFGITGVAFAVGLSYFILFLITSYFVYSHIMRLKELAYFFIKLLLTYLYILMILLLLNKLIAMDNPVFQFLFKLIIFIIAYLPIFIILEQKESLFSLLFRTVSRFFVRIR